MGEGGGGIPSHFDVSFSFYKQHAGLESGVSREERQLSPTAGEEMRSSTGWGLGGRGRGGGGGGVNSQVRDATWEDQEVVVIGWRIDIYLGIAAMDTHIVFLFFSLSPLT